MADAGRGSDPLAALVADGIRRLAPYQVPRAPDARAKLDANEMPFDLEPEHARELAEVLAQVPLNRYPAADCGELRAAVAERINVSERALVFGNGSDELVQLLISAFSRPREGSDRALVLYPTPSFIWFRLATLGSGLEPLEVPLGEHFELDLDRLRRVIASERPNVAFFARPNNPTGTLWPSSEIAGLAAEFPDVLFISDEAYAEYCGDSMIELVPRHPNLAVMRTLSKIGLAALRIGYLYAADSIVAELEKVRAPYNVGALNQAAAVWLLRRHPELLSQRCSQVIAERERMSSALDEISGVTVYPSQANLLLIRIGDPGDGRAGQLWEQLRERGVLVRNLDRPGPLAGCLRVTIGTRRENDLLLAELGTVLS